MMKSVRRRNGDEHYLRDHGRRELFTKHLFELKRRDTQFASCPRGELRHRALPRPLLRPLIVNYRFMVIRGRPLKLKQGDEGL